MRSGGISWITSTIFRAVSESGAATPEHCLGSRSPAPLARCFRSRAPALLVQGAEILRLQSWSYC